MARGFPEPEHLLAAIGEILDQALARLNIHSDPSMEPQAHTRAATTAEVSNISSLLPTELLVWA